MCSSCRYIQSQLAKLQQDLKITHGKLDNLTVRAPVTGRLTAMDLKVGENRNRGERFGRDHPGYRLQARCGGRRVLSGPRSEMGRSRISRSATRPTH